MRILAIDTSSRAGSVAFLRDNQLVADISGHDETLYSTRLFRDLDAIQASAQFRMDQIDLFAVVAGPGSFTGLRVGLAAVKAWAEVHAKPIAAISGLEAIAAQYRPDTSTPHEQPTVIAPFSDARRGQVFGSVYVRQSGTDTDLKSLAQESVFSAQEFLDLVKENISGRRAVLVSPSLEIIPVERVAESLPGVDVEAVSPVLAPIVGRIAFARAMRGELVDALQLDANYVRRSDAESAWKDS